MWLKKTLPQGRGRSLVEPDRCLPEDRSRIISRATDCGPSSSRPSSARANSRSMPFFRDRKIKHLDISCMPISRPSRSRCCKARRACSRKRRVDYLFIATHSQALHQDVVDRLKAHGYRVEISSDFEEQSTSFDGFVFASSPEVDSLFGEIEVMGRRRDRAAPAGRCASVAQRASRSAVKREQPRDQ